MKYEEIDGDLIGLALQGRFDVIAHGCNCMSHMGAGIAVAMAKTFGCDTFDMEQMGPNVLKLGNIDHKRFKVYEGRLTSVRGNEGKDLLVVNAYTQNRYGRNHADGANAPLDYDALTSCMRKINAIVFPNMTVGLPRIGAGLAGGDWERIKKIIKSELTNCNIIVVNYKK